MSLLKYILITTPDVIKDVWDSLVESKEIATNKTTTTIKGCVNECVSQLICSVKRNAKNMGSAGRVAGHTLRLALSCLAVQEAQLCEPQFSHL